MKMFEVGKEYLTENGSKVGCCCMYIESFEFEVITGGHGVSGWLGNTSGSKYFTLLNGAYKGNQDAPGGMSVVGPWVDPSRAGQQIADLIIKIVREEIEKARVGGDK